MLSNYIPMYSVLLDPVYPKTKNFGCPGRADRFGESRGGPALLGRAAGALRTRRTRAARAGRPRVAAAPEDFEGRDHLERPSRAASSDRGADESRRPRAEMRRDQARYRELCRGNEPARGA